MEKRTDELMCGDRVRIGDKNPILRTVDMVQPNGLRNDHGEPLWNVMYREGATPEWGRGNSATADTKWDVVTE